MHLCHTCTGELLLVILKTATAITSPNFKGELGLRAVYIIHERDPCTPVALIYPTAWRRSDKGRVTWQAEAEAVQKSHWQMSVSVLCKPAQSDSLFS